MVQISFYGRACVNSSFSLRLFYLRPLRTRSGVALDFTALTSNLNLATGQVRPNLVVVRLNASGEVTIYNNSGTVDVLADVVGYYAYHVGWTPDGSEVTLNRTNRRQNIMEFTACAPASGWR